MEIEKTINQLRTSKELLAILMFLSEKTIFHSYGSEYVEVWHNLLQEMKQSTSLIFIYEDNFLGTFSGYNALKYLQELDKYVKQFSSSSIVRDIEHRGVGPFVEQVQEFNKKGDTLFKSELGKYHSLDGDKFTNDIIINKVLVEQLIEQLIPSEAEEFHEQLLREAEIARNYFEQLKRLLVEEQSEKIQKANQLIKTIQASGVELVPYKKNSEIFLRVDQLLDEIDRGIFFHLYVPTGRYQEDQLASFLRLFESYLQRVENLQVFIETKKTLHGQIYEFKSVNTTMNLTDLEVALSRFDQFMSLCQNDQKKAEGILLRSGMNPSEASRLLTKYVKEYQRLSLDIEHERERKMLDLRQRLESEALDMTNGTSLSVMQSAQPSALLSLPHNFDPIGITISNSSVIINPGLQTYVEQAIYGDIHYTTEDKELLLLFEQYAERLESILLRSQLEQLKDTSSSETDRKTAKQKIVGLLAKVAPTIGQSALDVLMAYVEKKLIGS